MNPALEQLAARYALAAPDNEPLRLAFAHACAGRIRHLLEDPAVDDCLQVLGRFVAGTASRDELEAAQLEAARLASSHPGSKSLDGAGHAAVSASYAVAKAVAGRALDAASYAAYATVYAQGGSAAVADLASFEPEFAWQRSALQALGEAAEARGPASP